MSIFAIVLIILTIACIVHGVHSGMINLVYGLLTWIFVLWFINAGSPYIQTYLIEKTEISVTINEKITDRLYDKYEKSEEEQSGSGNDALLKMVPQMVREKIDIAVANSVDALVSSLATSFTNLAIQGIAIIIAVVLAYIIAWLVGRLVLTIGYLPGINGVNRFLGAIAGVGEALLITWLVMFLAEFFPASSLGQFVLPAVESDDILKMIYNNNIIHLIL